MDPLAILAESQLAMSKVLLDGPSTRNYHPDRSRSFAME